MNAPIFRGGSAPTVIVGGGFTGLSAAYELARAGRSVLVLEQDPAVGGLAGGFPVGGFTLERFYHHWFTNDVHVMGLIGELGLEDRVVRRPTRTGMYYANTVYRLSTPADLLKFEALGLADRIRLGLLALRARGVRDWRAIEHLTAREWLLSLGGPEVFRVVWEPLLKGKFGEYADRIGAVWFWNKLVLRGGSRAKDGREVLAYFQGGFPVLAEALKAEIERLGGEVRTGCAVLGLEVCDGRAIGVRTEAGLAPSETVLLTQPLPLIADMLETHVRADYVAGLRRIEHLANVCLVLELDRSLSETYWLNVNDPDFPFVGVIEHTNFEPPESYGGRHVVYLSKYLPESAALYRMSADEALAFAIPHLKRMFPAFSPAWITGHHVWRAPYAQPVVGPNYSQQIPGRQTPLENVQIASMAQIYPEDRGTNYAVREGRRVGRELAAAGQVTA